MQDKIIAAIAAYLERETNVAGEPRSQRIEFGGLNQGHFTHAGFCQEVAEEIATAIAPHLEAGKKWEGVPDEYKYRTVDRDGMVCYWDKEPTAHGGSWVSQESPTKSMVRRTRFDWESTLEQRPG